MIRVKCPKCKKVLRIEDRNAGAVATCPGCSSNFRVPRPKTAPAPPATEDIAPPPANRSRPTPSRPTPPPPRPRPHFDEEQVPILQAADEEDLEEVADEDQDREAETEPAQGRGRFKARPYKADGGLHPLGLPLVLGVELVAGLVLGFVTSFIGQWFYLIFIFPIAIGFAVGFVGIFGVHLGKVRHPILGGLLGFFGGCVAMISNQYFDYLRFREPLDEVRAELEQLVRAPADRVLFSRGQRPKGPTMSSSELQELRQALEVRSFPAYIDFAARQGVSIGRGSSKSGINLGHIGTYIYWVVELLIVAGLSFLCVLGAAGQPYCGRCNTWKDQHKLGPLDMSAEAATKAVKAGALNRLRPMPGGEDEEGKDNESVCLQVYLCPSCRDEAPVVLELQQVRKDNKGEKSETELGRFTYSAEALPALRSLFPGARLGNGDEE